MSGSHDAWIAALSLVVAVIAAYASLDLASRVIAARGRVVVTWLLLAACALGMGIWAMHFIGMLAFHLPIPLAYDIHLTLLSAVPAFAAAAIALEIIRRYGSGWAPLTIAGLLLGTGIVAMHYTGMAAIAITPPITYDPGLFFLSVLVADADAIVALWFFFRLRPRAVGPKLAGVLAMGGAIAGMHYVGMAAARFDADAVCLADPWALPSGWLAVLVATGTITLLAVSLLAAVFDARLADQNAQMVERLRREKEIALAASRAKSMFLANMSHELRTPLNAIIGFSDCIRSEIFGPLNNGTYAEYVDNINESGRHLLALINDILDVSRIETGALKIHEEPLNLSALAASAIRLVQPRAQKQNVQLHCDVPEDFPPVLGGEREIKQVLVNLLSNAIKFTGAKGTVTLRARLDEAGGAVIEVADTGRGMDAAGIVTALQPFGQVGTTRDHSHEGTGLGLPLSKGLVEVHGGSLGIESTPGVGTTVTVRLPGERVRSGTAPQLVESSA